MKITLLKAIKCLFLIFIISMLLIVIFQWKMMVYAFSQAKGQLKIIFQTEKISTLLQDKAFPDSLKQKIVLIQNIKKFAVDSLGLNQSNNYTSFYNQHDKPILWVITAAPAFEMIAQKFYFPILGEFSYKGFFDKKMADEEYEKLKKQGLDVQMNEVSAWSTLGYLNDPILSSMLKKSEGSLARLIIHEMTHGTIFVKNSLEFNENLADFVGEMGAKNYLEAKYGKNSPIALQLEEAQVLNEKYSNHLMRGASKLDSLYRSFKAFPLREKKRLKFALIQEIMIASDTLFHTKNKYKKAKIPQKLNNNLPNNAYFIGYMTYRSKQNVFKEEFYSKFNGDFKKYLGYLKQKYPNSISLSF